VTWAKNALGTEKSIPTPVLVEIVELTLTVTTHRVTTHGAAGAIQVGENVARLDAGVEHPRMDLLRFS